MRPAKGVQSDRWKSCQIVQGHGRLGIWETVNGEQKLTTECIENVIMMVPFSAVVIWNNWRIDVLCGDEGKKVSVKMYEIVIY